MNPYEELLATTEHLERLVSDMALLVIGLRRITREMRTQQEPEQRSDFDYKTGMPPKIGG